jgi:hypothetical protein
MGHRCAGRRMICSRPEWQGLEPLEQRCFATAAPGAEFLVNTWTSDVQTSNTGAISSDDAGNFVAVWESFNRDSSGSYGIYAQRFLPDGTPAGAEFLVNSTVLADQRLPAVAMSGSGAFVIAWEGHGTLGPTFPGIYLQRYDATGTALGTEIAVAGSPLLSVNDVAVAMNASGAFVVAWEENGPAGRDIAARIYSADGSPIGAAFTVNQTTAANQRQPQLVLDSAGNFAVTWNGNGSGDDAGVFARLFGPTGTPLTDEVRLNTTTTGTQSFSSIARDANGQFIVVWSGNGIGDTAGVFARRMSPTGMPSGSEFRISATTTGTQQRPSIAFDPDDEYVVSWSGFGAADTSGIYGREFWSDDTPKATEFPLNTTTSLIQINASVAPTGDNSYVVTWNGPGAGDADGIFGRLLENVAPLISTSGGSADHTEDGAPAVIDWALTVSDPDSLIAGATVQIGLNYISSEDVLVFTDQLGITGSWNPITGVLTLTGAAPAWDYEVALQSVAYLNLSQNPSPAPRVVFFAVDDGSLASMAATAAVTVMPVNDAPAAIPSGPGAVFIEDNGPTPVDAAMIVADVDSALLSGATVQIADNYTPAEDSLVFTDQSGITGAWDPATGILTLAGTASVADYQAALRTVRYANSSQDPSTLSRAMVIIVSDGLEQSSPASSVVNVIAMNEPPLVSAPVASAAYTEDAPPVAIAQGLGLSDADSPSMESATVAITANYQPGEDSLVFTNHDAISGSWDAAAGVLTLSGTATVAQYEAALRSVAYVNMSQNPSGVARTVTVRVSDGMNTSSPVEQTVSVTPVNDAPGAVGSAASVTFTEGGAAVPVNADIVLRDIDSAMLSSAVVRISGNFVAGEDTLVFNAHAGITGVWQAATGTLTLSGAATVAAYQEALRSVRYLNTSADPSTAPRTVTLAVMDDAGAESAAVSRQIDVVAVTAPPSIPTPPSPPRPPAGRPCIHVPAAPPILRPPHVPSVAPPFAPAGRDCDGHADSPSKTINASDVIFRTVGERRSATGGARRTGW